MNLPRDTLIVVGFTRFTETMTCLVIEVTLRSLSHREATSPSLEGQPPRLTRWDGDVRLHTKFYFVTYCLPRPCDSWRRPKVPRHIVCSRTKTVSSSGSIPAGCRCELCCMFRHSHRCWQNSTISLATARKKENVLFYAQTFGKCLKVIAYSRLEVDLWLSDAEVPTPVGDLGIYEGQQCQLAFLAE